MSRVAIRCDEKTLIIVDEPVEHALHGDKCGRMFNVAATLAPHVEAGRLKAVAILTSAGLPGRENKQGLAQASRGSSALSRVRARLALERALRG
jgi:hypothetical protein